MRGCPIHAQHGSERRNPIFGRVRASGRRPAHGMRVRGVPHSSRIYAMSGRCKIAGTQTVSATNPPESPMSSIHITGAILNERGPGRFLQPRGGESKNLHFCEVRGVTSRRICMRDASISTKMGAHPWRSHGWESTITGAILNERGPGRFLQPRVVSRRICIFAKSVG